MPPSEKNEVAKVSDVDKEREVEKHGRKKESVREAIAAIQQATGVESSQAGKKQGGVEEKKLSKPEDVASGKHLSFSDGPQWNKWGEEDGGRNAVKHPNQNKDQIGDAMYVIVFFFFTSIMLTLNPTTLFYWSLSDPPP